MKEKSIHFSQRIIALMLAVLMAFAIFPFTSSAAYADGEESENGRFVAAGNTSPTLVRINYISSVTGKVYPTFCLDYQIAYTTDLTLHMGEGASDEIIRIAAAATQLGATANNKIYNAAQALIWQAQGAELTSEYTPYLATEEAARIQELAAEIVVTMEQVFFCAAPNDKTQNRIFVMADGNLVEDQQLFFPYFEIEAQKYDAEGGFDNNTSTGRGDAVLDATIQFDGINSLGGQQDTSIQILGPDGQLATWLYKPWISTEDLTKNGNTYEGSATITVTETPPVGYKDEPNSDSRNIIVGKDTPAGTGTSVRTYTLTYKATMNGTDVQYEIAVDGVPFDTTGLNDNTIFRLSDNGKRAEFHNQVKKGNLQLVKLKSDDLDPFTPPDGSWNSGKHPMVNSHWSMRLISGGSENSPYVRAIKVDNNDPGYNVYVSDATYVITNDGSGTLMDGSDEAHSFVTNEYGQLYIYNIPFGKYELKETQAENDGYVLETVYIDVQEQQAGGQGEGKIVTSSTTTVGDGMYTVLVTDDVKKNEIQVVKTDSETGKVVPMANTTFRIRYMGREGLVGDDGFGYDDANIGRLLLNGSAITGNPDSTITSDKYLFYTDFNGKITLPYELEFGNYQLEELCAPEGYYIGTYDETGTGSSTDGSKGFYDTIVIYDDQGNKVDFYERDAEGNILYDENGNPISKTDAAGELIFNIYPFSVTEDNKDETVIQIVEMKDNAVKGKVEIYKTAETLAGFKKNVDENGQTLYTPVYVQTPLGGATFDIYSAEDITVNDSIAPPDAYKRADDSEIIPEVVEFSHSEFPNAVRVERKELEDGTVLEYITEAKQETLENQDDVLNMSYATLSTAVRKGTSYELTYEGTDADGNTVKYTFDIGFEYAAGGWNYTEVHITKETEFAVVGTAKEMPLPEILNGDEPIQYTTAVYSNGNRSELLSELVNEGRTDPEKVEIVTIDENSSSPHLVVFPEMKNTTYTNEPVYTQGYTRSDFDKSVYIQTNGTKAEDEIAVANPDGSFKQWMLYTDFLRLVDEATQAGTPALAPVAVKANSVAGYEFLNKPAIPDGYTMSEAGASYNISNGTEVLVAGADESGNFTEWLPLDNVTNDTLLLVPIVSDAANTPAIPEGASSIIIHPQSFEASINGVMHTYVHDEQGNYSWMENSRIKGSSEKIFPDIPEGYEEYAYIPFFMIKSKTEDSYMIYAIDHTDNDTQKWIPCTPEGEVFTSWVQDVHINLVQHNESKDGWSLNFDGFQLTNVSAGEELAHATITNPFEGTTPTIKDGVGCTINTNGNVTDIKIPHPTDTAYFKMQDGIEVSVVYLGGYTKTIIKVPEGATFPEILDKNGNKLDLLNQSTNKPVGPDYTVHEIVGENGEYVRTTYIESVDKNENGQMQIHSSHTIEVVSSARKTSDSYTVKYYDGHTSKALVMTNVETGLEYGKLYVYCEGKTMRYPLGKLVETITSGENGIAVSSELPLGTYYIREASAPSGVVTSKGTYEFTLSYEGQYIPLVWASTEIENAAMDVQLDLYKAFQTEEGGTKFVPKAGAVFGVYAYSDITASATASDGTKVDTTTIHKGDLLYTVTTDAAGRVLQTIRLPKGDYYVQEISTLPGYEVSTDQYIFRVDENSTSGALKFDYELNGIFGTITQTGKGTADIEINTRYQVPMPIMKVNGKEYKVLEDTVSGSVENANQQEGFAVEDGFLAKNVIDEDRSTFTISASKDTPITVEFTNGSKLILTVEDETYTAQFIDGTVDSKNSAVNIDIGTSTNLTKTKNEDGSTTVSYSPVVAYTGYTVATDTTYNKPNTKLSLTNGVTAAFTYDTVSSSKKVAVAYPDKFEYIGSVNETVDEKDTDTSKAIFFNDKTEAPNGVAVDTQNRVITIEASAFSDTPLIIEFGENGQSIEISKIGEEFALSSKTAKAVNSTTGEEVKDGYQADTLRVENVDGKGKTIYMGNRTITIESAFGQTSVDIKLAYGQEFAEVTVNGTINRSWVDGNPTEKVLENTFTLNKGKAITLLLNDGATYSLEITDEGILTADVQAIANGGFSEGNGAPVVKLNGLAENLVDNNDTVIVQSYPLNAQTKDKIVLDLSKTVTYARSDSSVSQIEVKINSRDDSLAVSPIKNYKKPTDTPPPEIPDNPNPTPETMCVGKEDVANGKGVPGATLMVKDSAGNIIANGVTGADGKLWFEKPGEGTFYLTETIAPTGYGLNTQTYRFKIDANGKITGTTTVPDGPDDNKVYIRKEDTTNAQGIPGAGIQITNKETGEVIFEGTTNSAGYISFEKPAAGTYEFRETVCPDGYFMNETVYTFTVHENGTITGDNTITDVPNTIPIEKTDYSTGKPLKGATIELYDDNGVLIKVGVTDEEGKVYMAVPDYGTYHYKESVAPEGYILDEGTYTITINRDGTITGELKFTNEAIIPQTGIEDWLPIGFAIIGICSLAYVGLVLINKKLTAN